MYAPDDSIISWRGVEIPRFPAHYHYVYLLHFSAHIGDLSNPRGQAGHYLGSASDLEARLARHKAGNGSKLMEAVGKAGITWEVARLWRVESWEAQRDLEIRLKRKHDNPAMCPLCRGKPADPLTLLYQRRWPFHLFTQSGKRQPMGAARPMYYLH